ncbi:hypothetical protein ASD16_12785 [Cellulomonas sp. Root485]|uniref:hypothetical protein n=1 Tax=Cellulomonas sp. Root485 TaxID=1736546 RepID=UPI0006F749D6|nr:hypothetical protein [Cellulomonas sp. Root485]KQY23404.1 hypothetical protein ASD16_12785 [Cellulomonas sp. Root485]
MTSLLARLKGTELAQVWFVRDYLQLIFESDGDHWSLQCWVWPRVVVDSVETAFGASAYRDLLCGLIGEEVVSTSSDRGLTVQFGASALVLDSSPDEPEGPEIAMLHVHGGQGESMVWVPGGESFQHLA